MPRGGRRSVRVHQTGASNRGRVRKLADPVDVASAPPRLELREAVNGAAEQKYLRSRTLLEPPAIVRTKLGGTLLRPSSRCSASRYSEHLQDHCQEHDKVTFIQPEWANTQPLLGVPEWDKGEAPQAQPLFVVTEDIFESPANISDA